MNTWRAKDFFDVQFIRGNPIEALSAPDEGLLSERLRQLTALARNNPASLEPSGAKAHWGNYFHLDFPPFSVALCVRRFITDELLMPHLYGGSSAGLFQILAGVCQEHPTSGHLT